MYITLICCLQIVVPQLPSEALKRQIALWGDDSMFDEEFIEQRRKGLETFINRSVS
jgi:sorting nexin-3/12